MSVEVLIVGGGSIGERHLRCFQQIGCAVALCESNAERRGQVAEQYHVQRVFDSLAAAAQHRWTGVVICTPAHLHVEHAAEAAMATNALLIEKPLCTRLEDAQRLRDLLSGKGTGKGASDGKGSGNGDGSANGKTVQIAYVLRHHPATQYVRKRLAEGHIGELHQVTVTAGQHFPTFRPAYRDIYYARREAGGGAVQDAATHLFDLVQHLAGPLDWVFCDYAHQELADVDVEDTVHLLGRAADGKVLVSLALNQFMPPNETNVQLNGARGSLAIRFHEQRAGFFGRGDAAWQWTEPLVSERDELFRAQAESFLSAARGERPPICSLDDGIRALQANLAALKSGRDGTVQRLG